MARTCAGFAIVGVILSPLAFGSTQVWALCALQGLAIGVVAFGHRLARWPCWCLPAVVLALGILQIASLRVHPANPSPLPQASQSATDGIPELAVQGGLSINPGLTRDATVQSFLICSVLICVAGITIDRTIQNYFVIAACVSGSLVLAIGLATWQSRSGPLLGIHDMQGPVNYWKNPLLPRLHSAGFSYPEKVGVGAVTYEIDEWNVGDTFGPYVVSNHYAGCMELTIPLIVAVLAGTFTLSFGMRCLSLAAAVAIAGAALACVSIGAVSWAGTASLLMGLIVVGFGLSVRRWSRCLWALILASYIASCAIGFAVLSRGETLIERVAHWVAPPAKMALATIARSAESRAALSGTAIEMFQTSPWTGLGLGSFADAYPVFRPGPETEGFAHNDYTQLAAEAGLVGIIVASVFAALVVIHVCRGWKYMDRVRRPMAVGVVASLAGFLLHGLFDWNFHVPANAWIFAVLTGTLIGMTTGPNISDCRRTNGRRTRWTGTIGRGALYLSLAICVALIGQRLWTNWLLKPLASAVTSQRYPELPATEKRHMLAVALPDALRAMSCDSKDTDGAETIARAYLHLSEGVASPDLRRAQQWFERTMELAPCRVRVVSTLREIGKVLEDESERSQ